MMNSVGQDQYMGRVALNSMEAPFYQNLFCLADVSGMGMVDGNSAQQFFQKSGLPNEALAEIWQLSDAAGCGQLDQEGFAIACRLVAHAQNGLPLSPASIHIEPPALPIFDLGPRPDPEGYMQQQGYGNMMDPSMGLNMFRDSDTSLGLSNHGAAPGMWAITEADRANYFSTFQQTDTNADGYVEGMDARELFTMSGLPDNDLMLVWNLADFDQDGRLNESEFLVAMHLVTKRQAGAPIPDSLPDELMNVIACAQAPSPTSPFPSAAPPPPIQPIEVPGGNVQTASSVSVPTENEDAPSEGSSPSGKKSTKNDSEEEEGDKSFGDLVRVEREREAKRGGSPKKKGEKKGHRNNSDDEATLAARINKREAARKLREEQTHWGDSPSSLIESVIEADKRISKTLAQEVDKHDSELRRLNEISRSLKQEVVREKMELERQLDRKLEFQQQAEEVRLELERLKDERRKVDLERISMNRDINHYQEETLFLKQQKEDILKDIQMLNESNGMMDKAYKQTDEQIQSMDLARRNVLESLREEQELLKADEREIAELKTTIERMRREKENVQSKQYLLQERLRQADQDRSLLISSLETDRSRLASVRAKRIDLCKHRQSGLNEMTQIAKQDWLQNRGPTHSSSGPPPHFAEAQTRMEVALSSRHWGGNTKMRDAKGVPSGVAANVTSFTQLTSSMRDDERQFGSNKTNLQWTSFGSQNPGGPPPRGIENLLSDSRDMLGSPKSRFPDLDIDDYKRRQSDASSTFERNGKRDSNSWTNYKAELERPRAKESKSPSSKFDKVSKRRPPTTEDHASFGQETPSFGEQFSQAS